MTQVWSELVRTTRLTLRCTSRRTTGGTSGNNSKSIRWSELQGGLHEDQRDFSSNLHLPNSKFQRQ